jgi:NAD(P)-dependent dehydrogenase (short-subunit alcohol dehydrogenase family)
MGRICVVTGSASGIGAATASLLRRQGCHVIGSDLHDADIVADLTNADGRSDLVRGVSRLAGGRIDAVVANAGGGPPETSLALNFFGAVATLEGLRPLLENSSAPRAVAVSSIASLARTPTEIIDRCLEMDEPGAIAAARTAFGHGGHGASGTDSLPDSGQTALALYATAKQALQHWCRRVAPTQEWAGMGITLNVVALGFYDTPAAAYVLSNPPLRASMAARVPLRGAFPGRPEEAAALLAWCISPENSQMTGQVLFADAGYEVQLRKERAA